MGAFSPSTVYTGEIAEICMSKIFRPTIEALNKEGRTFRGVLYFGLILTKDGPKVLEYNARFGDPETQVVLPRLKNDLLDIIEAVIDERLNEIEIEWDNSACLCVIMASEGYPQNYRKGLKIFGLDAVKASKDIMVFHAGTKKEGNEYYTNGGRVLGVTALGQTLKEAKDKAYRHVSAIHFEGAHYRRDIGNF